MQQHDQGHARWRRLQIDLYDEAYKRVRLERSDNVRERFHDGCARQNAENASGPSIAPDPDDKV